MRRLILLRHAKAVPMVPELEDHDRVLADRGRSDATRVAQFLKEELAAGGFGLPDLVLCSSAARTRQTLELLCAEWGVAPPRRDLEELYLARWLTMINLIRQVREEATTLLVLGHNPGLEQCAKTLARPPQDGKTRKLHQLLQDDFPTAALAILDFEIDTWSAVERGEGELAAFVRPRDLRGPEPY